MRQEKNRHARGVLTEWTVEHRWSSRKVGNAAFLSKYTPHLQLRSRSIGEPQLLPAMYVSNFFLVQEFQVSYYVAEPARPRVVISKHIISYTPASITTVCSRYQKHNMQSKGERCCKLLGVPVPRFDLFR